MAGLQGLAGGENGDQVVDRVFFWDDGNVLELGRGGGCATL